MSTLTKSNSNNFIQWYKGGGSLTLEDWQRDGFNSLNAVNDLTVVLNSSISLVLNWTANSIGEEGYQIWRSEDSENYKLIVFL
jgi:hypothetical protein